jgi:hypothetical protein
LQVGCRLFACTAVGFHFVGDLLAFSEAAHTGTLKGCGMNEDVLAAGVRLNAALTALARIAA